MWAKKQKNHDGLSASKKSSFRVKFSLLIAEFSGDLCKHDCSLNVIAFIQIAPTFLMPSEFTPCPNPPQSTIWPQILKWFLRLSRRSNEVLVSGLVIWMCHVIAIYLYLRKPTPSALKRPNT